MGRRGPPRKSQVAIGFLKNTGTYPLEKQLDPSVPIASCFRVRFIAALWSPDLLALACDVKLCFVTFPYGILGQVWYLFVSIPDFLPPFLFDHVRIQRGFVRGGPTLTMFVFFCFFVSFFS